MLKFSENFLVPFLNMAMAESREKTFIEWPYKKGKCSAKEMAKAGFYVIKKGDIAVTCYFCFKELEGWEENDDPFQEHKKHAPYCEFVSMFDKAPETITFTELLKLERARAKRLWELQTKEINESIQELVDSVVKTTAKRRYRRKVK